MSANDEHPGLPCHVCEVEKAFIKYGSKIGKDGREAKWPIYEKCPNSENHEAILAEKRIASKRPPLNMAQGKYKSQKQEELENKCKAPVLSIKFTGFLYDKVKTTKDLIGCLVGFERKTEGRPLMIAMHPADIGRLYPDNPNPECNGIAILSSKHLSHSHMYACFILRMEDE